MKVRLKVLPNEPRDVAWPPPVRAARCLVKSSNEQDLRPYLLASRFDDRALYGDCLGNQEEGAGNGRSVWLESSGPHARGNGNDNGMQLRKEEPILETLP